MPPVAFGNGTDTRRWGFHADGPVEAAVVGPLHFPSSTGSSLGLVAGGGGPALLDSRNTYGGGADISNGGIAGASRLAHDESQRGPPVFRGGVGGGGGSGGGCDDRGSPVPRLMDPRIIVDSSNGIGGGGLGSGGGGGGPPSRQGSPYNNQFEPPRHQQHSQQQQQQQPQMVPSLDAPPSSGPNLNSYGLASRMPARGSGSSSQGSGRQTIQIGSAPPPRSSAPPRHRSIFDNPAGMAPPAEHPLGPSRSGDSRSQGSEDGGVLLMGEHGAGGPAGPSMSLGHSSSGGRIGAQHHQQGMGGGAPVSSWHHVGQGNQQQHHHQHQQPHHSQQQHQHQHQHHRQQHQMQIQMQQMRRPSSPSGPSAGDALEPRILGVGPAGNGVGLGSGNGGSWGPGSPNEDPMPMGLQPSSSHGGSGSPNVSAVPTVLERFPGFVRCVMDIAPEVVGWVIGRSGAHIKEMKHRSGCGMWVDQKDLKLYITGADMPRIHAAARLVGDLISKAPVNVNSAGVEDEVTSHMIECPPHLIGLLIGRGGSTIKRIKEESRANVVINQKMMKVIVSGIPQSVRLGVAMIEDVITFGRSAEHAGGLSGHHPNFLDFPGGVAFGGIPSISGMSDYDEGSQDRFSIRAGPPPMSGGGRLVPPPPPFAGGPSNLGGGGGGNLSSGDFSGSAGSYDGFSQQQQQPHQQQPQQQQQPHRASPTSNVQQGDVGASLHSLQQQAQAQSQSQPQAASERQAAVVGVSAAAGGGGGGQPAEMGYDGKDMDWSVFSASSTMFNIASEGGQPPQQQQQSPLGPSRSSSFPPPQAGSSHHHHQQLSGLPISSSSGGVHLSAVDNKAPASHGVGARSSSTSALLGFSSNRSRTGSVSSGGTPPLGGRNAASPWNIVAAPLRSDASAAARGAGGSPGAGLSVAVSLQNMQRLSITSDDSSSAGRSLGQANRQRERAGTPVGNPADLAEFLGEMGLGDYTHILTDNEIDLEAVQLMADSDFQDIGIPKGPRVKLLYALRSNRHPPRSGNLSVMRAFMTSLGLERYCKAFEDEEVDMGAVDVMEESDYAQLGVAKGPRLKIMNVLAKSSSGTNSSGSNSGSVSTPSPEPRLSPKTSASSHHSFPVGSMSLGMSSAAAAASGSALSARAWSSVDATPEPAAHLTDDGEDIPVTVTVLEGSSSVCSSAGGVSAAIEILSGGMDNGGGVFKGGDIEDSRSNKGEKVENEVKGVSEEEVAMLEEGAGLGLPPRWDSVTSAERSLSPPADVWVSSALASEGGDGGACTS